MQKATFLSLLLLFIGLMENCSTVNQSHSSINVNTHDTLLKKLMLEESDFFEPYLQDKDELGIQVIYTRIDRKKNGTPVFNDYSFNLIQDRYFYPASTVKLPVAILALQKLKELNIPGLDKYSTMLTGAEGNFQTEVNNDPTSPDGRPTIAHYIKKILLVSDNDAFNRLYEFLGQEYINSSMHKMGYKNAQIIHRLSISLPDNENRATNPVSFYDKKGKLLYKQAGQKGNFHYQLQTTKMGSGYMQNGKLVNEPFDFTMKNRLDLGSLHSIIRSIMFPNAIPSAQRFNITEDDYNFLRKYMSMRPAESRSPYYPSEKYWDNYVKMIYYGSDKQVPSSDIRIFNKTGTAYGFLIDAAYLADYKNKIEFFVSAVIYCNSDGIFNDDKYDYEKMGYPFLKKLGQLLYQYELKRTRKNIPDLTSIRFSYQ